MITINNLKKKFGTNTACDIPSFTINDGDILGLLGNNGAGKTTLFRLMLDLLKADEGNITISNNRNNRNIGNGNLSETVDLQTINVAESEEWKQFTGAYIDEGFLIDFLTPEEYFSFIGKISNMNQDEVNTRMHEFDYFANNEIFDKKKLIRNLSAGNKQKVGIISALFNHPELVILDEPFNFLDPTSQNVLKRLLVEYNKETGATILISSHNLSHTIDISTRIVLLEHGEIIRDIPNNDDAAVCELKDYFKA